MRTTPTVFSGLAVLALATAALTGCTTGTPAACDRPSVSDPAVMDLISVTDDFGNAPRIDIPTPLRTDTGAFADIVTGDGTPITSTSQLVGLGITLVDGTTGQTLIESPVDLDAANVFALSQWVTAIPSFETALHCATEGSRVAIALTPDDIASEAAVQLGLGDEDSAVAVVDVRKVYLPRAEGRLHFTSGNGLPTVVRAVDGRPGVSIPDGAAPTESVVQTLITGDGAKVTGEVPVRVHYTGIVWGENEPFQTTWDTEPASITLDGVVPGFAQALTGQTVGSQVLVVIPPAEGYGAEGSGPVPGDATIVFVIDILGLDAAPAS